ncbi:condensin-2 complex subunit D3-like [Antedon mediterranea]|uniref:condensin-2 complex subunit D3-like n=1 Tax=Antedon mediterranea TaxID=105859 RepID=UPI003AF74216
MAQLCPKNVSSRIFMLVQSILAGPGDLGIPGENCLPSSQASSQPSYSQVPISQFCGSKMSNRVRAFAFITIGKLCLQHESLAKQTIAAIARELETSTDTAIRNNVVIVLCDLCKRYPNLVNHYIPNIASCLKDKCPLIRRQTLTLLTHLLLEDFIKWRGCLFFHFIVTMVDEVQEILLNCVLNSFCCHDILTFCFNISCSVFTTLIHMRNTMFITVFTERARKPRETAQTVCLHAGKYER